MEQHYIAYIYIIVFVYPSNWQPIDVVWRITKKQCQAIFNNSMQISRYRNFSVQLEIPKIIGDTKYDHYV